MEPNTKASSRKSARIDDAHETSLPQIVASIEDVLTEILVRLPLKSIMHFRSVSKHWNSIISSQRFHVLRHKVIKPNVAGFIVELSGRGNIVRNQIRNPYPNDHGHAYFLSLEKPTSGRPPFKQIKYIENSWPMDIRIKHSCNGLLVCASNETCDDNRYDDWRYYICNPTTKKYSKIPQEEDKGCKNITGTLLTMILAFDPSKSPYYKVVSVRRLGDPTNYRYQFYVYSSATGSWRKCVEPFTAQVIFIDGVYWNGSLHWLPFTEYGNSIYFNPDDDEIPRVMPTPPVRVGMCNRKNHYFGESCDHLHYINYASVQEFEFNVYEMRRDYSEWFVKYKVGLPYVRSNKFFLYALVRGIKNEDLYLVLETPGKVIRYNLADQSFEFIYEFDFPKNEDYFLRLCSNLPRQYRESLCPL